MAFQLNLQIESVANECSSSPLIVPPEMSTSDVLKAMKEERRGSVTVGREKLLGIFTERDALRLMASGADLNVPIETVMTRDPTTVLESDTVETAIKKMAVGGHRRLPIVDSHGKTVGEVKGTDVLHYLVQHFPEFVYNLPPHRDTKSSQREGA